MIIAVDFDGTIAKGKFPEIGNLIPQAALYLTLWKRNKHKLILWTCREGEALQEAVAFCKQHGIEFDAVNENIRKYRGNNSRKIWADLYVDDKCGFDIHLVWMAANQRVMRG